MPARLRSRAAWVMADQAISSLATAGLTIGLAHIVPLAGYGTFAVAYSAYSLVLVVSQTLVAQVYAVVGASAEGEERARIASAAAGMVVIVGIVGALALAIGALFAPPSLQGVLLVTAVAATPLVLQDAMRTLFVVNQAPNRAFVIDLLWIVMWALGFVALHLAGVRVVEWYIAAWGASAAITASVACAWSRTAPDIRRGVLWPVRYRDVAVPSLANGLAVIGSIQLAFLLVGGIGSVLAVGALRASQTLLGPLNIVSLALTSFAVPEIARRHLSARQLYGVALGIGGALALVALTWSGVLLLLPQAAGKAVLGSTWDAARTTLPGLAIYSICAAGTIGATAVMRALNRVRSALYVSVILGPLVLIASVIGVRLDGAAGAAAGFAVAGALIVPPCWLLLRLDIRAGRRVVPAFVLD